MKTEALKDIIKERGYRHDYLAKELKLSIYGFSLKLNGKNEFKISEVEKLTCILNLSSSQRDNIFFQSNVNIINEKEKYNHWKAQSDEERARQELKEMGLIKEWRKWCLEKKIKNL